MSTNLDIPAFSRTEHLALLKEAIAANLAARTEHDLRQEAKADGQPFELKTINTRRAYEERSPRSCTWKPSSATRYGVLCAPSSRIWAGACSGCWGQPGGCWQ